MHVIGQIILSYYTLFSTRTVMSVSVHQNTPCNTHLHEAINMINEFFFEHVDKQASYIRYTAAAFWNTR